MKDKRYILSIGLITVAVLGIGTFLWSSGTVRLDTEAGSSLDNVLYIGEAGAPITIDIYADFT